MEATTATKTMTNRMRHKQFLPFGDLEQIGDLRAHVKILLSRCKHFCMAEDSAVTLFGTFAEGSLGHEPQKA